MRLLSGSLSLLFIYLISDEFKVDESTTTLLAIIIGTSLIFQSLYSIELWFQAEVKAGYAVAAKSIALLTFSAIKLLLVVIGAPLIAFAFVTTGEFALGALLLCIAYQLVGNRLTDWKFELRLSKTLISESWPEILAGLSTLVCMRMDQIMIGQMVDTKEVGIYNAASQIAKALYFIPVAIVSATFPAIVAARSLSGLAF